MGIAMLNYDVFEAFRAAGVADDKARRAAEALSGSVYAAEIADLKSTQELHSRMIWAVLALNSAIPARLLISA